jgi:hypothetical protein
LRPSHYEPESPTQKAGTSHFDIAFSFGFVDKPHFFGFLVFERKRKNAPAKVDTTQSRGNNFL